MNPLLNDYYTREKNAMALYDDTVKAAQGNAAMGANPLAPKLTATPGGIMPLAPLMGAGGATLPMAPMMGVGGFDPFGGQQMAQQPYGSDEPSPQGGQPIRRGSDRWEMGDDGRLFDPNTGQHKIVAKPRQQKLMGGLPFGGFRARGGPISPGQAYIVGERGPEMIVPAAPGMVLPNTGKMPSMPMRPDPGNPALQRPVPDFNPVNGRVAMFDGMPRSKFFASNAGKTGGSLPVYNEIRGAMAGQLPPMDPRSFGTGGMNFMGPPLPSALKPTMAASPFDPSGPVPMGGIPGSPTGMLVSSSMGGVKWQPGTGPLATLPPQQKRPSLPALPMRPLPFNGSRIPQAPQNHSYDHGLGFGPGLAGLPTRQIGRSANDPQRIAERMRRQGDPRAIMQLGQMQMGQDFARERDAVNFAQGQQMFGQQQQAMDARDARNFQQGLQMFGMQRGAMEARDAANFMQQQQLETQRRAAKMAAQEAERNRVPNIQAFQVPDTGYVIPVADGRAMGTLQMTRPETPLPPGMVPTEVNRGGVTYKAPGAETPKIPEGIQYEKDAMGKIIGGVYPTYNPQGKLVMRRIDLDGDGVVSPQEQAAAQAAAGTTTSGFKFSLVK